MTRLLIANRGEIALRIIRTATELELGTVAVYAEDDADSPHVHAADEAIGLLGAGPAAYLDHAAILAAAKNSGAELIHPGYGFLSEQSQFARACASAGFIFVGPDAAALDLFGNKSSARRAATAAGVPVLPGTDGPSSVDDIRDFAADLGGPIVIKALSGGGGRGMRIVHNAEQIDDAYRQCAAEAELGFGDPALFAEEHLADARHIEVQIVATPGRALALGDRDCSIQRRHQKLVEIAPAQGILLTLRRDLHRAAARLCAQADYRGIATVEFLVTGEQFVFLEVNPRIQVEHTVTEEVTGVDLVAAGTTMAADEIRRTEITQPLLAATALLSGRDVHADVLVGHSVGAWAAAALAGVLGEDDCMRMVGVRGQAVAACCDGTTGMSAVLGGEDVLAHLATHGLTAANVNAPGQVVAAGALEQLQRLRDDPPVRARVRPLPVAGAFHTAAMAPAVEVLAAQPFPATSDPRTTLVSDVDGTVVTDGARHVRDLIAATAQPVRFDLVWQRLQQLGVTDIQELEPAGVLTGLARRALPVPA